MYSRIYIYIVYTNNICFKKPRACWIGLHLPKLSYCKPRSPFYQSRKRGRTTLPIEDFQMILQINYSAIICAYFVWRFESQPRIVSNLWRIWLVSTIHATLPVQTHSEWVDNTETLQISVNTNYTTGTYRYIKYTYVYTLNNPNVYLANQKRTEDLWAPCAWDIFSPRNLSYTQSRPDVFPQGVHIVQRIASTSRLGTMTITGNHLKLQVYVLPIHCKWPRAENPMA